MLLPARKIGLPKDSKAVAQQIRTIAKQRMTPRRGGVVPPELMIAVDAAIKLHLALL